MPTRILGAIRYRFFLFAGLIPYFLGAAWARGVEGAFDGRNFALGLVGVFFALVGVESFNEYFDSRLGTDRVFNPSDEDPIGDWVLWLGWTGFASAAACGVLLALRVGWPVAACMAMGGIAAVFYVGPPVRWVYRGLGEAMIALAYGPAMTLGSVSLHTGRFSAGALVASLVPGLLVMALAVANAVPDFIQDRLVGKRNLVVRLGTRRGVWLYGLLASLGVATLAGASIAGYFPRDGIVPALAAGALVVVSVRNGLRTHESPREFVAAVRPVVLAYLAAAGGLALVLATAARAA